MWLKHPRTKKPDTMLTLATFATIIALAKFMLNGVSFVIAEKVINLGTTDAALIGAILIPTLGAYVGRKFKDSPDKKNKDK